MARIRSFIVGVLDSALLLVDSARQLVAGEYSMAPIATAPRYVDPLALREHLRGVARDTERLYHEHGYGHGHVNPFLQSSMGAMPSSEFGDPLGSFAHAAGTFGRAAVDPGIGFSPTPPTPSSYILPVNSEGAMCSKCHAEEVAQGSSGARIPVRVKPGKRVRIVARPQHVAFRPEQIMIEHGERWLVHDIRVGNRSQFSQSGDIPGELFTSKDTRVSFDTCQTAMDIVFDVTYQGPEADGEQFRASVIGTAAN